MIDFIIKLEDMLKLSGYPDWEIRYMPDEDGYILKLDDHVIFMWDVGNKPQECEVKENNNFFGLAVAGNISEKRLNGVKENNNAED